MKIALIAALSENRAIGVENRLPWHLPEDLKRFRALTTGHTVIMGRRTFESIGRPLPNRKNIVVTRNPEYRAVGVQLVSSWEEAVTHARASVPAGEEVFVIGGAEIYGQALPMADRLYLTLVHGKVRGDAFFPDWSVLPFRETARVAGAPETKEGSAPGEALPYTFLTLDRA